MHSEDGGSKLLVLAGDNYCLQGDTLKQRTKRTVPLIMAILSPQILLE